MNTRKIPTIVRRDLLDHQYLFSIRFKSNALTMAFHCYSEYSIFTLTVMTQEHVAQIWQVSMEGNDSD